MRYIRIGKDIIILWSVFALENGENRPYQLVPEDCRLTLVTPYGRVDAEGATFEGNTVAWTFRGRDQKHIGTYSLELVQRGGQDGMVTLDICDAFALVAHSCEEGGSDRDCTLQVESEVRRIRIGKDFDVFWAIKDEDGAPYDLTGKDLHLCLITPYKRQEIKDYTVEGGTVSWTFRGRDQKHIGTYSLELTENQGKDGMQTVDTCAAFELVAHSCEETLGAEGPVSISAPELGGELEAGAVQLESTMSTAALELTADVAIAPYVKIKVDTELSLESENPVANYVLTAEIRKVQDGITTLTADVNTEGSVDYKINRALGWIESI